MGVLDYFPANISTAFNNNEPAHSVLRSQDSMAAFAHQVLNDLAKFRKGLTNYMDMSEQERAEKFYGIYDTTKREKELAILREELSLCNEGDRRRQLELLVVYSGLFDKYAPIFVDHIETWYRESFLTRFTEKMVSENVTDPMYHLISELHSVDKEDGKLDPLTESVNKYFLELLTDYNLLVELDSFTPEEVTDKLLRFLNDYAGDYADGRMHTEFLRYVKGLNVG